MTKSFSIFIYIIGSLLFLSFPIILSPYLTNDFSIFNKPVIQRDLISYNIGLFYFFFNSMYLIPNLYFKKKFILFSLTIILFLVLMVWLPKLIIQNDSMDYLIFDDKPVIVILFQIKHHLLLFFGVLFASFAFSVNDKLKKIHREKLITELSYLKAQINPHFLFNTLNSIYSLAIEKSDNTPTAIVTLSSMMRYAINDTSAKYVPLEKEIHYIKDYIQLQKIRLEDTAIINFSTDGDFSDKQIAPLLLIPFIENAFKYGVNPEEASQIDIQISVSDFYIYVHIFNLKVPYAIQTKLKTGFGIENGRRQLKLLYPNKHSLKIENKNLSFTVTIKINLT